MVIKLGQELFTLMIDYVTLLVLTSSLLSLSLFFCRRCLCCHLQNFYQGAKAPQRAHQRQGVPSPGQEDNRDVEDQHDVLRLSSQV